MESFLDDSKMDDHALVVSWIQLFFLLLWGFLTHTNTCTILDWGSSAFNTVYVWRQHTQC